VPGTVRNCLYVLRLASGLLMFAASLDWFLDASKLLRELTSVSLSLSKAQQEMV